METSSMHSMTYKKRQEDQPEKMASCKKISNMSIFGNASTSLNSSLVIGNCMPLQKPASHKTPNQVKCFL